MRHTDGGGVTTAGRHPYACTRCRSRKVKCDKMIPGCAGCTDASLPCVYTARRPRPSQKLQNHSGPIAGGRSRDINEHQSPVTTKRPLLPAVKIATDDSTDSRCDVEAADEDDRVMPREMQDRSFVASSSIRASECGRLFMANGKSRYIDGNKTNQVAELETMLTREADMDASEIRMELGDENSEWASRILLGFSDPGENLQKYYPESKTIISLWDRYIQQVDILVKVVYKPAVDTMIARACEGIMEPSAEPLIFAIWYASASTMSLEESTTICNMGRDVMLQKFCSGLEKSLAKASWMTTQNIMVLQALTLLIVFAPGRSTRLCWMLTGTALNIAQAMGLHRDGDCFSLSPVETEVRRRIWWTLCQLDNRISLDCGLEPHVPLITDTKLPLHINDSDLQAIVATGITGIAAPRTSFTEMTVSLIKIEMANISLAIKRRDCVTPSLTNDQVEDLIQKQIARYKDFYIPCLDGEDSVQRLCQLGARLITTKLCQTLYNMRQHGRTQYNAPGEYQDDQSTSYAADILDIARQLPDRTDRFGWFYGCKYTQLHTMAWLLMALCKRPCSPSAGRAWTVLDAVAMEMRQQQYLTKTPKPAGKAFILPLLNLLDRARGIRDASLVEPSPNDSNTPMVGDSGYESSGLASRDLEGLWTYQDGLLGDPFIGFGMDFRLEMNWEDTTDPFAL